MPRGDEISELEIHLYRTMRRDGRWLGSSELAERADMRGRTVRQYLSRWKEFGIVDVMSVVHPPRYRLADDVTKRAGVQYAKRLAEADAFYNGIKPKGKG